MQAGAMGLPHSNEYTHCNEIIVESKTASLFLLKTAMPYKSMKMMVDNVELRSQLQQNASQ
jgi:hypothetical protein